MGSGNQHRQIKKRKKQRQKREKAQASRGSRKVLGMSADRVDRARRWPMWDCWASQNWHEQGAHVYCCFARKHDDGTIAAVFFELDLAERGVLEVATKIPATAAEVHEELAKISGEDVAIVEVDPALVVKLVDAARDHGVKRGHDQPSGLARARRIFGSIHGSRSRHEVLVGEADPNAPRVEPSAGWFSGLKQSLGLGS